LLWVGGRVETVESSSGDMRCIYEYCYEV
jgi:hypothetical protein